MKTRFNVRDQSVLLSDDFMLGVATSAYQIEGAHNKDGKVESIWDNFCNQTGKILNSERGDIACDHYHLWQQDVNLLSHLNMEAYRFSIAWTRIIVDENRTINEKGLLFYENLVDALIAKGIEPVITLYHWDLPQYLQDKGGWASRETAFEFSYFAAVIAQRLGHRVKMFITLNEPWCSAFLGHLLGIHAPGISDRQTAYQVVHNLLLAHGLAIQELRSFAPKAKLGIALNAGPCIANTKKEEDIEAAIAAETESLHLFLKPILEGEYPDLTLTHYRNLLPEGFENDLDIIKEKIDFLGVNYYTREHFEAPKPPDENLFTNVKKEDVERCEMNWEVYPEGIYELLKLINDNYQCPPIYITENGIALQDIVEDGVVNDHRRVDYFEKHLLQLEKSIAEGIPVKGYFAWSFMDNFEWAEGYSKKFGIVHVDLEDQTRIEKLSAKAFSEFLVRKKQLAKTKKIDNEQHKLVDTY